MECEIGSGVSAPYLCSSEEQCVSPGKGVVFCQNNHADQCTNDHDCSCFGDFVSRCTAEWGVTFTVTSASCGSGNSCQLNGTLR